MTDEICACGHSKFDHAISPKGVVGWCMKAIIPGWQYCDCKKFRQPDKVEATPPPQQEPLRDDSGPAVDMESDR